MKAKELDLRKILSFNPKGGVMSFMGHRVLLFDAVAIGLLRKELIEDLGVSAARNILTRFGFAHGWRIADNLDSEYKDLLRDTDCGPVLHMLQGAVRVAENPIQYDPNFHMTTTWLDSYEAEQHLLHMGISHEPVCWTMTGYVSGYCTRMLGREVYCIEDQCSAMGSAHCHCEVRLREDWGTAIESHLPFFQAGSVADVLKEITSTLRRSERRLWRLRRLLDIPVHASGMLTNDKRLLQVLDDAKRVAKVESSVVITGESGVGKEMLAHFIHDESNRNIRPFVAVNCSAVAETLLESEFFGHVKGAFTGADRDRTGLFEAAGGGTIFLDEIAEISPAMQAKLLRVLQEKEIRRVGENTSRPVNVRVIAATNRNLSDEVKAGRFRRDLYFRLCVIELVIPPLRERADDILPLARFFLDKIGEEMGRSLNGFSPQAAEHLLSHNWPGNVRELQNVVARAVALSRGSVVEPNDLPPSLRRGDWQASLQGDIRPIDEVEREYILNALEALKWDKKLAAKKLNIGLTSLYRKLKQYKIA